MIKAKRKFVEELSVEYDAEDLFKVIDYIKKKGFKVSNNFTTEEVEVPGSNGTKLKLTVRRPLQYSIMHMAGTGRVKMFT